MQKILYNIEPKYKAWCGRVPARPHLKIIFKWQLIVPIIVILLIIVIGRSDNYEPNLKPIWLEMSWAQWALEWHKKHQVSPPRLLGVGFLVHDIYDDTW